MTGDIFVFHFADYLGHSVSSKCFVKNNGLFGALGRTPALGRDISWTQAYERRMRRFNLEVVLVAMIALALLIGWGFITWKSWSHLLAPITPEMVA